MKRLLFCSLILMVGCTAKISNPRLYVEVPEEWSISHHDFLEESPHCFNWWKALNDPILNEIIESLSTKNLDLLIKADELYSCSGIKAVQRQEYRLLWNKTAFDAAKTYIELRTLQEQFSIIEMQIESLQDTSHMVNDQWDTGFTNSVEKIQQTESLNILKSEISKNALGIQKAIHHLSQILGGAPNDLYCLLIEPKTLPALTSCLPIGFPYESIFQRPDVLQVEILVKKGLQPIRAYQKSVILALEEVENALAAFKYDSDSNHQLFIVMKESYKAYLQTDELYSRGLKNYLDVQNMKRAYLSNLDAYLQSEANLLLSYIKLYEALGL